MKILYLSSSPAMSLTDRRGYSTHIKEMIQALEQTGNTVFLVTGKTNSPKNGNSLFVNKIKAHLTGSIIEKIRMFYDIYFDFKYYFCAKKVLQSFSPDIIYERYAVFHQSGAILSKNYNTPLILELNSITSELDVHYGHHRRRLARKIEKRVLMSVGAIVVVSNFLRDYLLNLGIPASKIQVIPNGVDPNRFNPSINGEFIRKKCRIKDKIVIGFVGGFNKWHGADSLILAASYIIKKIKNIHFLLVGDGPMRGSSEKFVRDSGMSEYVTFTGSVLYEDIPQYIAAMDITSMPSSNSWGSPIKIFEYMAMEKPIIAPRVGPVEEIIDDGKEGLLIDPGNKDQLRDAILYLCENEELKNQIANNARQKVLKNYTWKKNASRIIKLASRLKYD